VWLHEDEDEVSELLPVLRPRLVLLSSRSRPAGVERVLQHCEALGAMLVLDASGRLALSPRGPQDPALARLGDRRRSSHLAVLAELPAGGADPALGLGVLFCRHARIMPFLEVAAELTYSRISCFQQAYCDLLLEDLLTSHLGAPEPVAAPLSTRS